jgi:hypothetical protein
MNLIRGTYNFSRGYNHNLSLYNCSQFPSIRRGFLREEGLLLYPSLFKGFAECFIIISILNVPYLLLFRGDSRLFTSSQPFGLV